MRSGRKGGRGDGTGMRAWKYGLNTNKVRVCVLQNVWGGRAMEGKAFFHNQGGGGRPPHPQTTSLWVWGRGRVAVVEQRGANKMCVLVLNQKKKPFFYFFQSILLPIRITLVPQPPVPFLTFMVEINMWYGNRSAENIKTTGCVCVRGGGARKIWNGAFWILSILSPFATLIFYVYCLCS